ncbi:hypothetical protein [Limosilactobacillus antri]|mgnify:FL=1|jgi:hypothetical protein|uniref:hypothetical protein n=1 Tax=Limosilactobacillus antri TaxID=227943 RepID=UPI001F587F64|nr:hypothetical protein [Limosilactobacillus antri]
MNWITPHSFLSLNWDEWASIIAILTAIVIILRWLLTRADEELFDPIRHQLQDVNDSLKEFNHRQSRAELRLEEGDKKFIHHDEQLKDHERRITSLEEEHRK